MLLHLQSAIVGLIVLGAAVMGLAILRTRQITAWLKQENSSLLGTHISKQSLKSWKILSALMTFFLLGYSLAAYLVIYQYSDWLTILTGVVFFFGALFVLFSVSVYATTLRQLIASQNDLRAQTRKATQALDRLKQVQHNQMLTIHTEKMRSLNQMAAGIAHEINNPANFINGNLTYLEEYASGLLLLVDTYQEQSAPYPHIKTVIQPIEEEIDLDFIRSDLIKTTSSMKQGSDRIKNIVASMRNFSRLDESQYKAANIAQGIESTLVLLQGKLNDSPTKVKIVTEFARNLSPINGNHSALNQAFLQILNNAIDAFVPTQNSSVAQPPTVKISVQHIAASWIQISIQDNGSGIEEKNLSYIFDPFFTTKPIGTGPGLGLSISHQIIVEQHCGRLNCRSTFGQGTTFLIQLPTVGESNKVLRQKTQ